MNKLSNSLSPSIVPGVNDTPEDLHRKLTLALEIIDGQAETALLQRRTCQEFAYQLAYLCQLRRIGSIGMLLAQIDLIGMTFNSAPDQVKH